MTAVEWLEKELKKIPFVNPKEVFAQAKEMEEQQRKNDYLAGLNAKNDIDYYNKTYASNGSELEQINQDNPVTKGSTALVKVTASQTEISDEEIEKGAWENPCLSRQDVYELFDEVFKDKTLEGMFKISASKEVRQFKERLRQLAKEKYREQLKQL